MTNCISTPITARGVVSWTLTRENGEVLHGETNNVITQVGDRVLAERSLGVAGAPAAPTGMKLGTGSTTPAKTGAGAALATYLTNSHQAFTAGPTSSLSGQVRQIEYVATWAAGKATTASEITEVAVVIDALADATSTAANTFSRALLSGVPQKNALDTLQVTWRFLIGTA